MFNSSPKQCSPDQVSKSGLMGQYCEDLPATQQSCAQQGKDFQPAGMMSSAKCIQRMMNSGAGDLAGQPFPRQNFNNGTSRTSNTFGAPIQEQSGSFTIGGNKRRSRKMRGGSSETGVMPHCAKVWSQQGQYPYALEPNMMGGKKWKKNMMMGGKWKMMGGSTVVPMHPHGLAAHAASVKMGGARRSRSQRQQRSQRRSQRRGRSQKRSQRGGRSQRRSRQQRRSQRRQRR